MWWRVRVFLLFFFLSPFLPGRLLLVCFLFFLLKLACISGDTKSARVFGVTDFALEIESGGVAARAFVWHCGRGAQWANLPQNTKK